MAIISTATRNALHTDETLQVIWLLLHWFGCRTRRSPALNGVHERLEGMREVQVVMDPWRRCPAPAIDHLRAHGLLDPGEPEVRAARGAHRRLRPPARPGVQLGWA